MALPLQSRQITQVVAELVQRVRQLERARRPGGSLSGGQEVVSSGHGRLDSLLPERGFRRGTLVEWLAEGPASGAGTLALLAARQATHDGGTIVVVDRAGLFYPPAAVRLGIDLAQLIVVRPESERDHAWALDQVLRTRGVAAVWSLVDQQDDHTLRRWQLAAETSGALGLLVRPGRVRDDPSWAELRLLVEPLAQPGRAGRNRCLRVTLVRSRAGQPGRAIELEIPAPDALPAKKGISPLRKRGLSPSPSPDPQSGTRGTHHETRPVYLASQLAAAKARRRSRGA
jgi:protein ImuA